MGSSIFGLYKRDDLLNLLERASKFIQIDIPKTVEATLEHIHDHKNGKSTRETNPIKQLELNWYNSLQSEPNYQVYSDAFYIGDIWLCWVIYSRKALQAVSSKTSMVNRSVIEYMGPISTIVDLGCGLAYTTAGLKELFPNSKVWGTNIINTFQFSLAKEIELERGFNTVGDFKNIGQCDLVFASEYFEHIINPIENLHEVVQSLRPKFFIIANGFNGTAIGHFNEYTHLGKKYSASNMSRMFNQAMQMKGYKKVKTKIWNGRPAVWERI